MAARIRLETGSDALRILMPPRQLWRQYPTFARILLDVFWLIFAGASLFITVLLVPGLWSQLSRNFNAFSLVCLLWSVSFPLTFIYGLYFLGRGQTGQESAEFKQDSLTLTKREFGFSRTRTYAAQDITNLEMFLIRGSLEERAFKVWGFTKGALEFKYENRRVRFGSSLDDAEAEYVLSEVSRQFPRFFVPKG